MLFSICFIFQVVLFVTGEGGPIQLVVQELLFIHIRKKEIRSSLLTTQRNQSQTNKNSKYLKSKLQNFTQKMQESIFMTLGLGRLSYRRLQSTDNKQKDQDKKITLQNCLPKAPPGKPTQLYREQKLELYAYIFKVYKMNNFPEKFIKT